MTADAQAVSLAFFDALLPEVEACRRYPLLLSPGELRKARQNDEIAWTAGKKGAVLYHPDDLAEYLGRKARGVKRCPTRQGSGNTEDTGSAMPRARIGSTPTGMTPEDALHVADLLAQKFSRKRKTS